MSLLVCSSPTLKRSKWRKASRSRWEWADTRLYHSLFCCLRHVVSSNTSQPDTKESFSWLKTESCAEAEDEHWGLDMNVELKRKINTHTSACTAVCLFILINNLCSEFSVNSNSLKCFVTHKLSTRWTSCLCCFSFCPPSRSKDSKLETKLWAW